jgi:putative hydrolase of the HAD superfamily
MDPRRVRAVVFDLGGVLIEGGPSEVVAFGDVAGLAPEAWHELRREVFGNDGNWARVERGEIAYADFIVELRTRILAAGGSVSEEEAARFMGRTTPMDASAPIRTAMIEAVRALREIAQTALLTNNVREWRHGWSRVFDAPELFDVVVDSSAVGTRKPEPAIYEITRERLGVEHEEIFFIDDIGQNLKTAKRLGWQTLLFTDEATALAALGRILEPA